MPCSRLWANKLTGTIGSWIGGMAKLTYLYGPSRRDCVVTVRSGVLRAATRRWLSGADAAAFRHAAVPSASVLPRALLEYCPMRGGMGGNACGLSVYECVGCHARFMGHHHVTHALRGAVAGLFVQMG